MRRTLDVAEELGYLEGLKPFLDEDAYGYLPRDKVLLLCTGSQGEARAALARIANDDHRTVTLNSGDMVIFSSRTIPGNEKVVGEIINGLVTMGIDVVTDRDGLVHVSGHPRRGEMEKLYELIKPEVAIPVHGEALHLQAHEKFARAQGVKEVVVGYNGDVIKLVPGPAKIAGKVKSGTLVKDGRMLVDPELSGVVDRRRLSFAGSIVASVVIDRDGNMVAEPDAVVFGLPETDNDGELFEDVIVDAIEGALKSIPRKRRRDPELVREASRRAARAAVVDRWGKKPLCRVMVAVV